MRRLIMTLMTLNAALFLFGAAQHAGAKIGPFEEPHIFPAMIVETICGLSLLTGAVALAGSGLRRRGIAIATNGIALCGVLLGQIALAAGRGPRTASNDRYHLIMLLLIAASLAVLLFGRMRPLSGAPR